MPAPVSMFQRLAVHAIRSTGSCLDETAINPDRPQRPKIRNARHRNLQRAGTDEDAARPREGAKRFEPTRASGNEGSRSRVEIHRDTSGAMRRPPREQRNEGAGDRKPDRHARRSEMRSRGGSEHTRRVRVLPRLRRHRAHQAPAHRRAHPRQLCRHAIDACGVRTRDRIAMQRTPRPERMSGLGSRAGFAGDHVTEATPQRMLDNRGTDQNPGIHLYTCEWLRPEARGARGRGVQRGEGAPAPAGYASAGEGG